MNYYFITGTSRGLGKAITNLLLKDDNSFVFGLARTNTMSNSNFEFSELDLNNLDLISKYNFKNLPDAESIILINNSGQIGDIKHIGDINNSSIIENYNVNIIAPSLLINNFVKKYKHLQVPKSIINISSGAGRHPIESWSTYCASKAALDMFSNVLNNEQEITNNRFKVFSVAPGIIDTKMQDEIRTADFNDFNGVNKFKDLKSNNQLSSPQEIAEQIIYIINNQSKFNNILLDVRDI